MYIGIMCFSLSMYYTHLSRRVQPDLHGSMGDPEGCAPVRGETPVSMAQ